MTGGDPLRASLVEVVGPGHVLDAPELTAGYETDWTRRWSGRSRCVVRPAGTDEVAAVVRACATHGAAIVPQGGNTGLVGGGVPRGGEVVVSLTRLGALSGVDRVAAQVTAGAGVTLADLHRHAASAGLAYGVDMASRERATVGGTIATDAGGIRVVRHGTTRDQVLGLTVVLPDGSVLRRAGGLVKDTVGYDLVGLLVGSEGTLGIVTEARLRLVPRSRHRVAALLPVGTVAAALEVLVRLRDGVGGLEAVELMERSGASLVAEHLGTAVPVPGDAPWLLLVEVAGMADPTAALAAALADAPVAGQVAVAVDGPGRARLWRVREAHAEAIAAAGIAHKLDVAVPLSRLQELVEQLPATVEAASPGARTVVFGHLAEGNLHVNVLGPAPDDERVDDAVLGLVARLDGTVGAEHGVGVHKVRHVGLVRSSGELALLGRIKAALDPEGRCNPGVLLPGGRGCPGQG